MALNPFQPKQDSFIVPTNLVISTGGAGFPASSFACWGAEVLFARSGETPVLAFAVDVACS
jgi:hypothetical protein